MRNRAYLLLGFVALTMVVILLGRALGYLTAPSGPIPEDEVQRLLKSLEEPDVPPLPETAPLAQAGIYVGLSDAPHVPTVLEEVMLAHHGGVRRFFLEVPLDFGAEQSYTRLLSVLSQAPEGEYFIVLLLDPDTAWLDTNSDSATLPDPAGRRYASIASDRWSDAALASMAHLASLLRSEDHAVAAIVLTALEEGNWSFNSGNDGSDDMRDAYRIWLANRYESPESIAEAWGREDTSPIEEITLPVDVDAIDQLFLTAEQRDFSEFLYATTVNRQREFVEHARTTFGQEVSVWLRFGNALDRPGFQHAQWILGHHDALPAVDGIVLPLSNVNRGAGKPLGPPTAVDSLNLRGIPWFLLDDTRTGISWDRASGRLERPTGFDADVLLPIFDRNAAVAALSGGGILWADPDGAGNLLDSSLMEALTGRLPTLYELQRSYNATDPVVLSVVLDAHTPLRIGPGNSTHATALESVRTSAQQTGVQTNYIFLDDLLAGRAPETRIAIFPNAYQLDALRVEALHAHLEEHGVAAIWLYAPGVAGAEEPEMAIASITEMSVRQFETTPAEPSMSILAGNWIREEEVIGEAPSDSPSFYIDDERSDVLARYGETEESSVAMRFMESGWASIYIATPAITPDLLKEILEILDAAPSIRPGREGEINLIASNGQTILLHGDPTGDRNFEFDARYDVMDLLDPASLWPNKRVLAVPLRSGGTRLLELRLSVEAELIDPNQLPPDSTQEAVSEGDN